MKSFNIGIIGTGEIAKVMADTITKIPEVHLYGVASRTSGKAETFSAPYEKCIPFGSYQDMVKDNSIDLVYIATPHSEHYNNIILCLEHDRNVLCEKAFTVNSKQARAVYQFAEAKELFLAEAMWTRYMPLAKELKRIVKEKTIGDITMVNASLHYPMQKKTRLWTSELAGGALLDVGIYPLTMGSIIFGDDIDSVIADGKITEGGIDEYGAAIVKYKNGGIAVSNWGMSSISECNAVVYGSEGYAVIHGVNHIKKIEIYDVNWQKRETIEDKYREISGYEYEILSCKKAIEEGNKNTMEMDWTTSIKMMDLMDEIRQRLKISYSCEAKLIP